VNNVGTRIANGFAAQLLAYTLPYRRFADVLADACAFRGDVDCYSFIAVDFHHILLASLPALSLTKVHTPRPLRGVIGSLRADVRSSVADEGSE
jgi:hypothetical protein